jgi:hypothetical protein
LSTAISKYSWKGDLPVDWKAILERFWFLMKEKRAEITVSDLPPFKVAEVIIGGTTYIINSFFKKDAKGDVVDKVRRLIERDAEKNN